MIAHQREEMHSLAMNVGAATYELHAALWFALRATREGRRPWLTSERAAEIRRRCQDVIDAAREAQYFAGSLDVYQLHADWSHPALRAASRVEEFAEAIEALTETSPMPGADLAQAWGELARYERLLAAIAMGLFERARIA